MGLISESQVRLSEVKSVFGGGSPPNDLTAYYSGSGTETDPSALAYPPLNVVALAKVINAQNETAFNNTGGNGTFAVGSGYVVSEVISLSNNTQVTVDDVSSGQVTEFTVTRVGNPTTIGTTLTQISSTGSGTGFTLTVETSNLESGFVPASGTIQLTDYMGATKANITAATYEANSQVIGGVGETVSGIFTLANDGRMEFEDVYNEITTDVLDEWTLGLGSSSINMNSYFRFVFNVTSASVSGVGGSITVAGTDVSTGYTGNISSDVPGTVLVQAIRGSSGVTSTTTVTFNLLVVRRDTSDTVVQKAITVRSVAVNELPE